MSPIYTKKAFAGVRQMLSEEIGTDQMQKLNEVSMQSEHNWCSEVAFTGSTKKYLELNPMNRDKCGRPDDLVGLDEITEVKLLPMQ